MGGAVASPPLEGRRVGRGAPGPELTLREAPCPCPRTTSHERYLKKAIAEINDLGREIAQEAGDERAPVLGSGHPQADIFLLKYGPQTAEQHEGVAFFGRAGQAVLKSLQRLHVDPTAIYGTNCLKFDGADEEQARELAGARAPRRPAEARRGHGARCAHVPERRPLPARGGGGEPSRGRSSGSRRRSSALVTPDLDASLDETTAKKDFWEAFKAIGPWWSELPPY